jgi:S1-C subfamily serine protease
VQAAGGAGLAGRGAVALRPENLALPRGARIFALGNPLDVGFAVAEGTYNGPVERSFLETLFFGGSLSAGMSGGPALDEQGRLIGVNVAARRDGEQVSFLVPAKPVRALIERGPGCGTDHQAGLGRDHATAESARGAAHAAFRQPALAQRRARRAIAIP